MWHRLSRQRFQSSLPSRMQSLHSSQSIHSHRHCLRLFTIFHLFSATLSSFPTTNEITKITLSQFSPFSPFSPFSLPRRRSGLHQLHLSWDNAGATGVFGASGVSGAPCVVGVSRATCFACRLGERKGLLKRVRATKPTAASIFDFRHNTPIINSRRSQIFRNMSSSQSNAMSVPRLSDYLSSTPSSLNEWSKHEKQQDGKQSTIHVVMGNEAGDADSIISAMALAYIENSLSTVDNQNGKKAVHLPLVSVPRADIALRRDVVLLLDLANIDIRNLACMDDNLVAENILSPKEGSQSNDSTNIILVDHNRIRSSLTHLSSNVSKIIDHHEDEGSHEHVKDENRQICIIASTCTLVAEKIFQSIDASAKIDGGLGIVLLGVILLDSVNMLPAAGKGTPRDEEMIQTLLKRTNWASGINPNPSLIDDASRKKIFPNGRGAAPDPTALFEFLRDAKVSRKFWSDLDTTDCLRLDYKQFSVAGSSPSLEISIGLSSILLDMDSLLAKDTFFEQLEAYAVGQNVTLFGILTLDVGEEDGKLTRELLLTGSNAEIVDSFARHLISSPDAAFLEIVERNDWGAGDQCGEGSFWAATRVFRQGNAKGSRKQVAPVLLNYASSISKL